MSRTLPVGLVLLLAMVSVSYAEYVSPREQQKAYAPLMVELPSRTSR